MQPTRLFGAAAVAARAVPAGIIDSSKGRATDAPRPFSIARRGSARLEMNMSSHFLVLTSNLFHLERYALHDADDDRREPVIGCRAGHDGADSGHVEPLDPPAQGVG